jgi:hypothetical protein
MYSRRPLTERIGTELMCDESINGPISSRMSNRCFIRRPDEKCAKT